MTETGGLTCCEGVDALVNMPAPIRHYLDSFYTLCAYFSSEHRRLPCHR